ncbi:MAG TPA: serine hydrolase domain-containing protein [Micromonosporaceae bacterium]
MLTEVVESLARKFDLPGVAVAVWADGQESYACHGVTSRANPLPVDPHTLFVLGSVAKTYTATAMMCLVERGQVDLDAPVRRYLPELVLADEHAAAAVTVRQLLNHTAGLDWRMPAETGDGDDALAAYVAEMAGTRLIAAPGERAAYSQIGYNLAGRVIERVTGETFESAVGSLLFEPLGLADSVYRANDAMTRRFAIGHNLDAAGDLVQVRQWKDTRANNPGGGVASSVSDQLRWARFHLGDGAPVFGTGLLRQMQQPTVELTGSSLGDAIGIAWFLRDIDGARTVGHGGSANGQFADLALVPERDFAVVVTSNAGPDAGLAFNRAVITWALEHYAGVKEQAPEPLPYAPERAGEIVGHYANEMMNVTVGTDADGYTIACAIKPEIRSATATELPPDLPPAPFGLISDDEYVVTGGGLDGQRGGLLRDAYGIVVRIDLAGRSFDRTG